MAITATADGSDAYTVEPTEDEDGGLAGSCDRPYGREGNFCKHGVAVGLAVLGQAESVPGTGRGTGHLRLRTVRAGRPPG
ncbi:hypothetical protein [Streptomyces sp. NPDC051921]|uniref:SWIM zinc finger family protein n=1 Tax=Streptomyces sp. NPDC051921 TaxID=3155806 RepID=UPI00344A3DF7